MLGTTTILLLGLLALSPGSTLRGALAAQGPDAGDGVRIGLTFGGISTVGFVVEYFDDARSVEVTVGTWAFRDLSVSVVGKEYFGPGALRPYLGLGLWLVGAPPPRDGERLGMAAVLRAPIGVDWRASEGHYMGAALSVNRALWARRTDPEDDLPLNRRFVPLPGLYYRWSR